MRCDRWALWTSGYLQIKDPSKFWNKERIHPDRRKGGNGVFKVKKRLLAACVMVYRSRNEHTGWEISEEATAQPSTAEAPFAPFSIETDIP